jgi:YidC/Oxa1 family membrane protein insertase
MKTEIRFFLAMLLMLGVLVGTNFLFPPLVEEEAGGPAVTTEAPSTGSPAEPGGAGAPASATPAVGSAPASAPGDISAPDAAPIATTPAVAPERVVTVEGPLFRYEFSTYGARMLTAELTRFQALNREGLVDLIPEGVDGYFGHRLVVGQDTVDLSRAAFTVEPAEGLVLEEGGPSQTLRFVYQAPTGGLGFEVAYRFHPDGYHVDVSGRATDVDRPLLLTDVGEGLAYAEADSVDERRMMAYVYNHLQSGIESTNLDRARPGIVEGPLLWTAVRSKFFVMSLLAGRDETAGEANGDYLGGLILRQSMLPDRIGIWAAQTVRNGEFNYRLFLGPRTTRC